MGKKRKQVRLSREEWRRIVAEFRSSGLSQREFAESRGLSVSSVARWSRRLWREAACDDDGAAVGGLVELVDSPRAVRAEAPGIEGARLLVGGSVCLELPSWPSPDYVALIARAYEAMSPC